MKRNLAKEPKKLRSAIQIIDRMIGEDKDLKRLVAEASVNAQVAQLIYDARTKAGLTQTALARLVGTSQPVIARLENAEYPGHSLTMLQRIAEVLEQRVEVRFKPITAVRHLSSQSRLPA